MAAAPLKPFGPVEAISRNVPWGMYARKRLDVSYSDFVYALHKAVAAREADRGAIIKEIKRLWTGEKTLIALSVRTGFDAIFRVMNLPKGSHVVCSAVTIGDMVKIVEHHGLQPIAVDLSTRTLGIDMELLRKAVTPETKMIVIAHIFGAQNPMDEVIAFAKERGIFVVEDCAEVYRGPEYKGHPDADASLFSFGTIKTATSFGGALMTINDPKLRAGVDKLLKTYPIRPRSFFMKRLLTFMAVHGLTTPALFGLFARTCMLIGVDYDKTITNISRGFTGDDLFVLLRRQPELPLLYMLHRRLAQFTPEYIQARIANSEYCKSLVQGIPGVQIPGDNSPWHAFWLFPIMVENPAAVCRFMVGHGYDVTSGATQLGSVDKYVGNRVPLFDSLVPSESAKMMKSIVYLPVTPEMSKAHIKQMVDLLRLAVNAPASRM